MNQLDYLQNDEILKVINFNLRFIKRPEDREDFRQEIWAELYDFMPQTTDDAIQLIDRAASKFKYKISKIFEREIPCDFG